MSNNIAVLMTCHNRKAVTLGCLQRLFLLKNNIDVYCVDDASTDSTAGAIIEKFPQVHLIEGDGNLFWCRGMNLAWKTANAHSNYDYYIWLNDDLLLYDKAFDELFECSKLNGDKAIISGIAQGRNSERAVYGGFDSHHEIISPTGKMEEILNLNGNFVLIPQYVFNIVGFFDDKYHHDIGDVDYGLTAREHGILVVTTRCFIGSTDEKFMQSDSRIRKNKANIITRFRKLYSPLGSPPFIHYHFIKKHGRTTKAIVYVFYLHFINILPDFIYNLLFTRKDGS